MPRKYADIIKENLSEEFKLLFTEHWKQFDKWGFQRRTLFEWMTYLTEEVGELAEAISEHEYRKGDVKNIIEEATQVGALAIKIILIAKTHK